VTGEFLRVDYVPVTPPGTGPRPREVGGQVPSRAGRPRRPPGRGRLARQAILLAFWAGLSVSVAVWWFGTPTGSVDSVGRALVEAGRITGMVAGYLLLVQVLMMSRVAWLDRTISANDLLGAHRDLGVLLLVMVLLHAGFAIVGHTRLDGTSVVGQTVVLLTTYEDMISAFVAVGILVGVALLAVRAVRAVLPYELWYYLHLATYLVLLLGYGHQFAEGRDLAPAGPARWVWLGFHGLVVSCVLYGRLLTPLRMNLRHRLRVAEVVHEGTDVFSVYVAGRRLDELQAKAGQFFRWRFLAAGCWWQAHPFSLSASPNGHWLRLTIKAVGHHTEQLKWLEPGVRILAEGPSGVFTADRRTRHHALLIAGGSGIAPIRALLEELPRGTVVIYRAGSTDELIFREELDWLAARRDAEMVYVLGGRDEPGPRYVMSPKGIRDIVPDVSRRDVYLCGPEGLVAAAVAVLRKLRVPRKQIHQDPFEF
jgi:predicted ferric reductase